LSHSDKRRKGYTFEAEAAEEAVVAGEDALAAQDAARDLGGSFIVNL